MLLRRMVVIGVSRMSISVLDWKQIKDEKRCPVCGGKLEAMTDRWMRCEACDTWYRMRLREPVENRYQVPKGI